MKESQTSITELWTNYPELLNTFVKGISCWDMNQKQQNLLLTILDTQWYKNANCVFFVQTH